MMISEKMVFTSSNGNHLVLYARPPAGISIHESSVRRTFLLQNKESRKRLFARWCAQARACKFHLRTSRIPPGGLFIL